MFILQGAYHWQTQGNYCYNEMLENVKEMKNDTLNIVIYFKRNKVNKNAYICGSLQIKQLLYTFYFFLRFKKLNYVLN